MALTFVITYDIKTNGTRAAVAAVLQSFGDRIQKSVFLATIDDREYEELQTRIHNLIDTATDSVYFFRQCAECWDGKTCLGQAHPPAPVFYYAAL